MGCLGLGVNNALFYGNSEDANAPYGYLADAQAGAPVTVAAGQRVAIAASLGASAQSMSIDGANVLNSGEQFPAVGSGRTLYLFAASTSSSSSGVTWTTAARVYSLRMSENGVPVRDFVPGVRNGKGCLYDRVTDKCYFDIAGTITAAAGLIGPPAGTPTRPKWTLSYIGSEGNAYIDTGIPGNPGVKAEVTFAFTDLRGNNKALLASWKSGSERCIMVARDGDTLTAGIDKFEYCEKNGSHVPVAINQPYTVTADFQSSSQTIAINGGGYGDDTILSRSAAMADTGRNLYLFTLSHADSRYVDSYRTAARIYSLKIWRDGELVRHYVPVIADNGGPYLFDKVTRTFHQGATSGLWDVGEVGERIQQGMSIVIR